MTTSYSADRVNLYRLRQLHPDWTQRQFADALGRSRDWVKKCFRRWREARASGEPLGQVLQGQSRARKHPPLATHPLVEQRLLAIGDAPPEGLRRVPGPEALLYYLPRDPELQAWQVPLPRSSSTIYRILKKHDRIPKRTPRRHEPMERPAPMTSWQADFKDVSSVPADPLGKQGHVVEPLTVVASGTSVLLDAQVRDDFTAEVALETLATPFQTYGRPECLTLDRDVRWVGSPQGRDFPSALVRFCACLGIGVHVCAPQHPPSECVRRALSPQLSRGMPGPRAAYDLRARSSGDLRLGAAFPFPAAQSSAHLWQSAATHGFSSACQVASSTKTRRS